MKITLLFCAFVSAGSSSFAGETTFVTGARPWNFQPRSREYSLQMQTAGPDNAARSAQGSPFGGMGYPIQSNSYAIGNWIQVEMTLAEGAEGLIMIENHQTNSGDQSSVSDVLNDLIESYEE